MSLTDASLKTVDDSKPERVEDVVGKIQSYRGRHFRDAELEETRSPLKKMYSELLGGIELPEEFGRLIKGIVRGVRRVPAKVFADYCSRILEDEEVTVEESSFIIRRTEAFPYWKRRVSFLGDELGLEWGEAKLAYRKGYKGACVEAMKVAANFLARVTPDGPKGPRAELASGLNICRVIGWPVSKGRHKISRYEGTREGGVGGCCWIWI